MSDVLERLGAALEGRYAVDREIGEGGMATVYLADDLKHERKVALKVLKPELAAVMGADRFLTEIRTTANLQHPHILPLFDSGEADGFLFYVMPYVEGESLRARLDKERQLPVDDAVRLVRDVAEALDHAHRQGVIHRDIKPANILMSEGRPLVSDFGIALAVATAGGGRLTETGLSLGTPHYMSPEQATADMDPGARSDVYSLGCVLYEALVGEPPFTGSSAQAILGRIITTEPAAPTEMRKSIPPNVEAAVMRALEKVPADRFGSAAEFAAALGDTAYRHGTSANEMAAHAAGIGVDAWSVGATKAVVGLAIALVFMAGVAAMGWMRGGVEGPAVTTRHYVELGPLTGRGAISPDGNLIAYQDTAGGSAVWLKRRGDLTATRLFDFSGFFRGQFSPDSRWMAFVERGEDFGSPGALRKIPVEGGGSVVVASEWPYAVTEWLDNGTIVGVDRGERSFVRVPDSGGEVERVPWPEAFDGAFVSDLTALPGSSSLIVSACPTGCEQNDLWFVDPDAGSARRLVEGARESWLLASGHLIYLADDGNLLGAPFNARAASLTGPAVPLVEIGEGSRTNVAISSTGAVLYGEGVVPDSDRWPAWYDRAGRVTLMDSLVFMDSRTPAISPDGTRVVFGATEEEGDAQITRLLVKELPDGPLTRITPSEVEGQRGYWSNDGQWIYFAQAARNAPGDAYRVRSDGSAPPELLAPGGGRNLVDVIPTRFPDTVLVSWRAITGGSTYLHSDDIGLLQVSTGEITDLLVGPDGEQTPALSPDGQWIAYASDRSGRDEVYVRPFPDVGRQRISISVDGGFAPVWVDDGQGLVYVTDSRTVVHVSLDTSNGIRVVSRESLFTPTAPFSLYDFDVTNDGERIFSQYVDRRQADARWVVIDNWIPEVIERVGPGGAP